MITHLGGTVTLGVLAAVSLASFAGAIVLVSAISVFQDSRSRRALDALRSFNAARATVIRNNAVVLVPEVMPFWLAHRMAL